MSLGSRIQADVQRTTQGTTTLLAALSAGRYSIKDVVINGNIHATGTVKLSSTTHVLAEYIPTYGHPQLHFSEDGFRLEEGEALTLVTGVADFTVNIMVIAYQLG
jgi:hypothetical protein